ncbi:MAG: 50S ribosomal protein L21 [Myxococcales bacterium]|nr:50S ribosomal protein L21 [Myxococcales bacterium]
MADYAIIRTGGKQYSAEPGVQLTIEKLEGGRGETVTFEDVLLVRNGDDIHIGTPVVANATVKGTITEQTRDKKVLIHKHKRRKKYRKTQGHRQYITRVRIDEIVG